MREGKDTTSLTTNEMMDSSWLLFGMGFFIYRLISYAYRRRSKMDKCDYGGSRVQNIQDRENGVFGLPYFFIGFILRLSKIIFKFVKEVNTTQLLWS